MKVVNGLKEYALGEKFVHDGFEYICIPDTGCCVDCDFHEVPVFCNNPNDLACLTQERSDSNRVSFKRLGECQEPKKKTEFAIGEEFQCGFKTLRCVAIDANSPKKTCNGCVFYVDMVCMDYMNFSGHCREAYRTDATDVIFIEVKPENKEK